MAYYAVEISPGSAFFSSPPLVGCELAAFTASIECMHADVKPCSCDGKAFFSSHATFATTFAALRETASSVGSRYGSFLSSQLEDPSVSPGSEASTMGSMSGDAA